MEGLIESRLRFTLDKHLVRTFDEKYNMTHTKYITMRRKPEGLTVNYFIGGMKYVEGYCRKGKRYGKYLSYYANGTINEEKYYIHGKLNGPFRRWFSNGKKMIEGQFKNGKEDGTWKFWNESGQFHYGTLYVDGVPVTEF